MHQILEKFMHECTTEALLTIPFLLN